MAAWVGVQVASLVFPAIDVSEAALRFVWAGFILAFPLVLVFAWLYDITPDGITRTPALGDVHDIDTPLRKADYAILLALLAVIAAMAIQLGSLIRSFGVDPGVAALREVLSPNTVAVLPLENVTAENSEQFLVDGIHEALISTLSRISALKVISRTSARRFANSDKSPLEIGQELHAANIIEGSVYRQGSEIRMNVRLIDAATEQLVWSNTYDRRLEDVLLLYSELALTIANEIEVLLTPGESAYLTAAKRVSPAAYESYLKGRFHWYRLGEKDLELALQYFREAIELSPGYALAYIGLADALATPGHTGLVASADVFPQAERLAAEALALDPLLAEAHDFSARIRFVWRFDWLGADREFREAIRLNRNLPDARIVYSQFLGILRRWDESLEQVRAGLELDPLNNWFRLELGARLSWMGRNEDALEAYLSVAADDPNWFMIHRQLWEVYHYTGDPVKSLQSAREYYALSGQSRYADLLAAHDGRSEYSAAMEALAQAMIDNAGSAYVSDFELARIFAFARNEDATLHWLERAQVNRDSQLVYSAADPVFSFIWSDPRYQALRQKMHLPGT